MPNISLSFDDSRRDFYTNVFPLLKEYSVPATLNVITARVKNTDPSDLDRHYLTVDEVLEIANLGYVEIASHSANHRNDKEDVELSVEHISRWLSNNYGGVLAHFQSSHLTTQKTKASTT